VNNQTFDNSIERPIRKRLYVKGNPGARRCGLLAIPESRYAMAPCGDKHNKQQFWSTLGDNKDCASFQFLAKRKSCTVNCAHHQDTFVKDPPHGSRVLDAHMVYSWLSFFAWEVVDSTAFLSRDSELTFQILAVDSDKLSLNVCQTYSHQSSSIEVFLFVPGRRTTTHMISTRQQVYSGGCIAGNIY